MLKLMEEDVADIGRCREARVGSSEVTTMGKGRKCFTQIVLCLYLFSSLLLCNIRVMLLYVRILICLIRNIRVTLT